jgi:transcriptional regulator with XRE-family HTH domain
METTQPQNKNTLFINRRKMGFSQKYVAHLLGFANTSMVSRYELGRSMPPLKTAFALGIILRKPLECLFPGLYDSMREDIRAEEERMRLPVQQPLF